MASAQTCRRGARIVCIADVADDDDDDGDATDDCDCCDVDDVDASYLYSHALALAHSAHTIEELIM